MGAHKVDKVRFLDIIKPGISLQEACRMLKLEYGITGKLDELDSERDLNFRVSVPEGGRYLLKFSNHEEPRENIEFEIAALKHIEGVDPDLPVPRIIPAPDGELFRVVVAANGREHDIRLLSFLPGTVLSEVDRTELLVFNQGKLAARLALALQGFFHPASGIRQLLWDVRQVGALRPIAEKIPDRALRHHLNGVIDHFRSEVQPQLAGLRAQVAHMDLTRDNLVVDAQAPQQVSGILDFGDMHHGPLVQDVAVALADVMQPEPDPFGKARAFLRGYQYVLPLQDREIALLFDLLRVYFVAYYLILARRGESYFPEERASVLAVLNELQARGREEVSDLFSQACGHPRPNAIAPGDVDALIARRKAVMGERLYVFYEQPLNITRGEGVWLYDSAGKAYLDVYNNVPVAGHAHPYIAQAVARQTSRLSTNTRYICDEIIAYAERLTATLPAGLDNASFVNSGSEANDMAWLMAQAKTGNQGIIIFEDAYHGWTPASRVLSPSGKKGDFLAAHVRTIPAPDLYRSPYDDQTELLAFYAREVDRAIDDLAKHGMKPAMCIVDSAFCSSGVPALVPGYLAMVFEKVRRAGGLCVADEVQSGFGRMGRAMWGFEVHGVLPDIVTFGKPMANGYPMGAVVTRPDVLAAVNKGGSIFATFGGNNVAAAAANAVLDMYEQEGLLNNSESTGQYLQAGLRALALKHPIIGDVRGNGLILGVELVVNRQVREPAPAETHRLLQTMSRAGVLLGRDGPHDNVLKLRPPLVFSRENADFLLQQLNANLARL